MSGYKPGERATWQDDEGRWFGVVLDQRSVGHPGCWIGIVVHPGNTLDGSCIGKEFIVPDGDLRSPQWTS